MFRGVLELSTALVEYGFADNAFIRVLLQCVALSIVDPRDT